MSGATVSMSAAPSWPGAALWSQLVRRVAAGAGLRVIGGCNTHLYVVVTRTCMYQMDGGDARPSHRWEGYDG